MIAFGPIPSRRLGLSLGINNIVSQKICSYSCVYCQIGNTVNKSMMRQTFYKPELLVAEVEAHIRKLDKEYQPDYLTFVANGEPTLDANLGKEIRMLKKLGIPVAVITNSSLICNRNVQDDLMEADWISLKVDAVTEHTWRKINRPIADISWNKITLSLSTFAEAYSGKLFTETMLIRGFNDSKEQLQQTASFIATLNPQKAYLAVPTRPPAVREVKAVSESRITEVWHIFKRIGMQTELLTGFEGIDTGFTGNIFDDVLKITAVHPLREDTMAELLKRDRSGHEVVQSLISQGLIKTLRHDGRTYYVRNYHNQNINYSNNNNMPRMNETGPEGNGPKTGRGLGKCKNGPQDKSKQQLGKGMGKRRNSSGGEGKGKRLNYYP